jgi:hypothetical protein
VQCVEARIEGGIEDCHIFVSSRHLERILPVNRTHPQDGSRLRFAAEELVMGSESLAILRTSSNAMRFWINKAIRESRYLTSFSNTKFFFDCEEIFDLRSRNIFWA